MLGQQNARLQWYLDHPSPYQLCADPEGGGGGRGSGTPLPKNHKNIGFLSHSSLDPLKKLQSYQASIQCWASKTPAYSGIWTIPLLIN